MNAIWLIPLLPAAGALVLAFLGRHAPRAAGWIATAAVFAALAVAWGPARAALAGHVTLASAGTFLVPGLGIDLALRVDALSAVMLFVVLGVGGLIHLFSVEYMAHDPSRVRFFACLNMFVFFMLVLVLGDNLVMLFAGWEGVGLASWSLIGFWHEKEAPPRAAIKAFLANRVGDAGFLAGIFLLATCTGTVSFAELGARAASLADAGIGPDGYQLRFLDVAALCLFLGACGKSAQFPLHVWLPDAMEGPTPVSALIHAATMVTAGIYMVARLQPLFLCAPVAREIMLAVAVLTALGAALAACAQTDLKRILAYSTISQLGYMMAGAAAGHGGAAVFHLATHGVFKALLFLSAGAVIHAMAGNQDIRDMGGLFRKIPLTAAALLCGAFSLAGVPLFAGFYSKDLIIASLAALHPVAASLLLVGAAVTAFYSTRMILVVLFGTPRFDAREVHPHDPGRVMLLPLGLLSLGTLFVGRLHVPELLGELHEVHPAWVAPAAYAAVVLGIGVGSWRYLRRQPRSTPLKEFLHAGYRLDDLFDAALVRPVLRLAKWTRDAVDASGIDAVAEGLAMSFGALGESIRVLHTGNLGTYLGYAVFGLAVLVWLVAP